MYERSANVLERYFDKLLKLNLENNLKINYENYNKILQEVNSYQDIVYSEEEAIQNFDEIASKIQEVQRQQEKIDNANKKLEEERNRLFNDFDEEPEKLEKKFLKIETSIEENNKKMIELREQYVSFLGIFGERQKERNKFTRERRTAESSYINVIKIASEVFQKIEIDDVKAVKEFISADKAEIGKELSEIMMKNGKNEKVKFDPSVIEKASAERIKMAEIEAECYVAIYEKMKKFLVEVESESLKLAKYQKALRDSTVKMAFINAEKEYIVGFLDNERMTSMNGPKIHKKMMEEACENFDLDMVEIHNLYELIMREIVGKATKKAYKELYNKTYLKGIEEKEKNFEKEVNHIKLNMGTVINSNYWRIEGIKNIYNVFQEEVSEKFEKDLSEYKLEEIEEYENIEDNEEKVESIKKFEKVEKKKLKINFAKEDEEEDEDDDFILDYNFKDELDDDEDDELEEDDEIENDVNWDDDDEDDEWDDEEDEDDWEIDDDEEDDDEWEYDDDEDEDEWEDEDDEEDDDDDEEDVDEDDDNDDEDDDDDEDEDFGIVNMNTEKTEDRGKRGLLKFFNR